MGRVQEGRSERWLGSGAQETRLKHGPCARLAWDATFEIALDGLGPCMVKALVNKAPLVLPDVGASVALLASPLSTKLIHDTNTKA